MTGEVTMGTGAVLARFRIFFSGPGLPTGGLVSEVSLDTSAVAGWEMVRLSCSRAGTLPAGALNSALPGLELSSGLGRPGGRGEGEAEREVLAANGLAMTVALLSLVTCGDSAKELSAPASFGRRREEEEEEEEEEGLGLLTP